MWSPLKSAEKSEEVRDVETVKAKALYIRQTFTTAAK
jgi:hypothetical protein